MAFVRASLYDDGRIRCDDEKLTIRWYYLWGAKRIRYRRIKTATPFKLRVTRGKWRVWGSGDLRHWYNLDPTRPTKVTGIELDLGRWARPCLTPDDPQRVLDIISQHLATS